MLRDDLTGVWGTNKTGRLYGFGICWEEGDGQDRGMQKVGLSRQQASSAMEVSCVIKGDKWAELQRIHEKAQSVQEPCLGVWG